MEGKNVITLVISEQIFLAYFLDIKSSNVLSFIQHSYVFPVIIGLMNIFNYISISVSTLQHSWLRQLPALLLSRFGIIRFSIILVIILPYHILPFH